MVMKTLLSRSAAGSGESGSFGLLMVILLLA
jgi:hypothetical protein